MNIQISARTLRLVLLITGLVGLLVIAFGVYTVLDASSKIDALTELIQTTVSAAPTPDPAAGGMSPLAGALMSIDRDRNEQIQRRGQAVSFIGFGAVIIGVAVLIQMRASESSSQSSKSRHA